MPGEFVLKKAKGGFHFVLKASNGETIAQSEIYSSKSAAHAGIESVKQNVATANVDDQTGAQAGRWRIRRAVRTTTQVAVALMLLSSAVWAFTVVSDNSVAVMRDSLMEPAVPMGALVVANDAHDAGDQVWDVVVYHPAGRSRLQKLLLGTLEVARQHGGFHTDAHPTVPLRAQDDGAESMIYYLPLVGYPLWFGPLGPLVVAGLWAIALYLTREPSHRVARALASPA